MVVVAVGLAFGAPPATAADAATAESLHARTSAWVASHLRVPVPVRTLEVMAQDTDEHEAVVTFATNTLRVRANLYAAWGDLARGPVAWDESAIRILIHESLHLRGSADPLNEGVVDAVAIDMTPAWMRAFVGPDARPDGVGSSYPGLVRHVRALSASATCGPWRGRDARLWRRAYLIADDRARVQMAAPRACPRTGA